MTYYLGKRSRARLEGVHPDLVRVVERAIEITVKTGWPDAPELLGG